MATCDPSGTEPCTENGLRRSRTGGLGKSFHPWWHKDIYYMGLLWALLPSVIYLIFLLKQGGHHENHVMPARGEISHGRIFLNSLGKFLVFFVSVPLSVPMWISANWCWWYWHHWVNHWEQTGHADQASSGFEPSGPDLGPPDPGLQVSLLSALVTSI